MGADIHLVVETKDTEGNWAEVPCIEADDQYFDEWSKDWHKKYPQYRHWLDNRNYMFFAITAGVRNGFGFAGVPTHEPVKPVAEGRGLPEDLAVERSEHSAYYQDGSEAEDEGEPGGRWLGEHSFTWMTLHELMSWPHWDEGLGQMGVVSRSQFETFKKNGEPDSWCGGISGPNIVVYDEDRREEFLTDSEGEKGNVERPTKYLQLKWGTTPRRVLSHQWQQFEGIISAAKRINPEATARDIRLVMGFDS